MPRLTKKQQAEQARQEQESRIRAVLHWTDAAEGPDVPPPPSQSSTDLAIGYMFNTYYLSVEEACTSPYAHAVGRTDKATSQRPMALYSTRLRALLALRNAVERECANQLAKIDRMIEEATHGNH